MAHIDETSHKGKSREEVTNLRLALRDAGYAPVAIKTKSKRPLICEWQTKLDASEDEIRDWPGGSTGMACAFTPTCDIDILDADAAQRVEDFISEYYDGSDSEILVRFGRRPKRAIPFRTSKPFPKMSVSFEDRHGKPHKIEFLCDGQQVLVDGIHEDTLEPYEWHGGYVPWLTPHDNLPEINEDDARALLDALADVLEQDCGFKRVQRTNGNGNGHDVGVGHGGKAPVDVDVELAGMYFGGGEDFGIHPTQLRCTAALLRQGVSIDEVVDTVLEATRRAVAGNPEAAKWNWQREERAIRAMCSGFIKKNPELDHLLHHAAKTESETPPQSEKPPSPKIEARPFVRFDPKGLPPRQWLYGGHYQRGKTTTTVGTGGTGKSSSELVEAVAMATGRSLLDEQPEERCRVWYHNAEDDLDEIYRRIAGICQHYGIDQAELEGWLFPTSGIDMPIKIASTKAGSFTLDASVSDAIIKTIVDNDISVASFDPLIATHNAAENVTGDMDQIIREFTRIASVTDAAIEVVHHTRKPAHGQEELTVADGRGAGAIIDAVRSARVLNTMSKVEAEKAGIDDVDCKRHFRIDKGKANMSPPTAARWYKFESVELPNGDNVGVVAPWYFPGQGSPQMAEAQRQVDAIFMGLLVRLTLEGRVVSPSAGVNSAPNLFCKEKEATSAKVGKAALADSMRRLFLEKRIKVETENPGTKRERKRLVVA
jgi:AAA domain